MGFGSDPEQCGPPPHGLNSYISLCLGIFLEVPCSLSSKHRHIRGNGPSEFTSVWLFFLTLGLEVQPRSRAADVVLPQVWQILLFQRCGMKGGDPCELVYLPAVTVRGQLVQSSSSPHSQIVPPTLKEVSASMLHVKKSHRYVLSAKPCLCIVSEGAGGSGPALVNSMSVQTSALSCSQQDSCHPGAGDFLQLPSNIHAKLARSPKPLVEIPFHPLFSLPL